MIDDGRVTIPAEVRRELGIEKGDYVVIDVEPLDLSNPCPRREQSGALARTEPIAAILSDTDEAPSDVDVAERWEEDLRE
ncbi:AbrB/MazE/SpoVT family DNA-binding domain-containing protein [Halobacterium salinarum]|uniref:AbrB/MazE/SpoVT family DNA-binding domain-containing protein n=1 Tax=Halobacterium salinarum TaxID=2242 RepID=UPI002556CE36|nr:AbrB/MazE/SpoVT family DNA-binding domain-containing protein [Halobacterium salinarum]MDL0136383.1 AbrB/MazE/SpoVT family DNA-binding domain-containing protein [Halobacterium salinarum]MDL0140842.1 AbrB/MazE/SpoVT family DNA-binding domain-containing protein [Halobacterium salinarum]